HFNLLFAVLDGRAEARGRQDSAQSMTAGADAFDERALRGQLDLELTGHHLALRFGIEADMTDNYLPRQLGPDDLADPTARNGRVIRDQRQIALFLPHDLVDHSFRRANRHEAPDHHGCSIGDHGNRLFNRDGLHAALSLRFNRHRLTGPPRIWAA